MVGSLRNSPDESTVVNMQLAKKLKANQERLEIALAAGNMGTWEWDIRSGSVTWSPSLEAMHQIPIGSFAGSFEAFAKDMHPGDKPRVLELIQQSIAQTIMRSTVSSARMN